MYSNMSETLNFTVSETSTEISPFSFFFDSLILLVISCLLAAISVLRDRLKEAERKYEAVADHLANVDVQYMKQLDTEREKGRAHMLKMRMQKRDCVSKVGSLQRKLRERSDILKALVDKVAKLEWAEEDVNELAEEIIQSRELLKLKDNLIEHVNQQLEVCRKNQEEIRQLYENKIALLQFQLKHQQEEEKKNKMVRKA
uniref:Uncharacterized protein n=1 Tax=Caenorhabditis japonica TaxID=281687 RepID=A0A8R1HKU6_CAEJA